MHQNSKTPARGGGGPLQHSEITVGSAKGNYWTPADHALNRDRLMIPITDEVRFRQTIKLRLAIDEAVLQFATAAGDLLGRNAVDLFAPRPHELLPTAGYDVCLEAILAKIG